MFEERSPPNSPPLRPRSAPAPAPLHPRFALSNQRVARGGEQPVAVAMPLEIQDPILVQLPSNATSASQRPLLCKNAVAENPDNDKLKPQGRLQDRAVLQPSQ